jgi:hypothetical protein
MQSSWTVIAFRLVKRHLIDVSISDILAIQPFVFVKMMLYALPAKARAVAGRCGAGTAKR